MAVLQPNQKTPAHGQRCSVKLLGSAHRTLVPPHQGGGAKRRGVVLSTTLFRSVGEIAFRNNPQSASLTAP